MGRSILLSPAYLLESETPQSQFYITKLRTTQMLPAVLPSCIIHVSLHRRLQTRTPSRHEALWNPFPRTSPYSITMPSITSITCAAMRPPLTGQGQLLSDSASVYKAGKGRDLYMLHSIRSNVLGGCLRVEEPNNPPVTAGACHILARRTVVLLLAGPKKASQDR